jgi:hypothetical protein
VTHRTDRMRQHLRRQCSGSDGATGKIFTLRWSAGDPQRVGASAAELAEMTPDLILASSSAYRVLPHPGHWLTTMNSTVAT